MARRPMLREAVELAVAVMALSCTPPASVPATTAPAPVVASAPVPAPVPVAPVEQGPAPDSVAALLAQHPTSGSFTVTGYISYIYRCPPCPKKAACKPCMGDNLVLSDTEKRLADYTDLGPDDLVILADRAQLNALKVGGRYRLDIELGSQKSTSQSIPDPHLRSAVAVP